MFFATGSLTRERVVSWATKISVYPLRLDLPLTNKSPKPTCELTIVACNLYDPRLSRQNKVTLFMKFSVFVKIKYFPKTPKTLKNLFVFESTKIEHVKTHFIKYNHTNETIITFDLFDPFETITSHYENDVWYFTLMG